MDIEDVFARLASINTEAFNDENKAREMLYKFLDEYNYPTKKPPYMEILNHLFRRLGLYPYMEVEDLIHWADHYAYEAFKVPIGEEKELPLHREQSSVLKQLLEGKNIALSAPTSFGKSFIIDAYIAIKKPKNVLIIVPTIALADETRRRINRKFAHIYKIITTTNVTLDEKNILIFPQERVFYYLDKIHSLDLLVIDEFYKIDNRKDKDRAYLLNKALIQLYSRTDQLYLLAPNIKNIHFNEENYPFSRHIKKIYLDFNTVFLSYHDVYERIVNTEKDLETEKARYLTRSILEKLNTKNLIYAGTHKEVSKIGNLLIRSLCGTQNPQLLAFVEWLKVNYGESSFLIDFIHKGIGVHTGRIHRSLAQIILKLFDSDEGLHTIISTSSIVEGINTAAENVFIWKTKKGTSNLDVFTYRNIAGRAGRMFRYFIGNIYVLDKQPVDRNLDIKVEFPENLLGVIDSNQDSISLTGFQINQGNKRVSEFASVLSPDKDRGFSIFRELKSENKLTSGNLLDYIKIARNIKQWGKADLIELARLKTPKLREFIKSFIGGGVGMTYVDYAKTLYFLSKNWEEALPEIIMKIDSKVRVDFDLNTFFELERHVSFNFSRTLNDFYVIYSKMFSEDDAKVLLPLVNASSYAFLPPLVYSLEEYGLPRMISKKIDMAEVIKLSDIEDYDLHETLEKFRKIGKDKLLQALPNVLPFDKYVIDYFYEGL